MLCMAKPAIKVKIIKNIIILSHAEIYCKYNVLDLIDAKRCPLT